ncbi:MAG: MerR family transcriptional regulator [Clostridiaceae bacterium]|nr:MerR family transcriptional regulator [Clostridiaceae bacterium]
MKKEYSIGEICKIYNWGADSLRYYEKKGIIAPKRKENGYRVYTLDDIWRLNIIKDLRKLGFSINQIKEYIECRRIDTTIDLMDKEIELIEKEIMPLIALKKNLEKKLKTLKEFRKIEDFEEVKIKKIKERKIIFTEDRLLKEEEVDLAFRELESRDDTKLFLFANKDMGVFISEEGLEEGDYTLYQKAFFFVEENEENYDKLIPEGYFATLIYRGSYKKSQKLFEKVMEFIEEKEYVAKKPAIEIYRFDIHGTAFEEEFITEIQIPLIK